MGELDDCSGREGATAIVVDNVVDGRSKERWAYWSQDDGQKL
jgi:hypothetical protein